jgi:hypothetical protein
VQPMEVVPSYTPRHPPVRQATWSGKVVVLHFQTPPPPTVRLRAGLCTFVWSPARQVGPSGGPYGSYGGKALQGSWRVDPPPTFVREDDGTPT